jgi:hypothetical protein
MNTVAAPSEPIVVREVFGHWTVAVPAAFEETFVAEDGYWHAWDARRSVSLTSLLLTDRLGRSVPKRQILEGIPAQRGETVPMPPGFDGWAVVVRPPKPRRASRAVAGMIAVDGRVLLATVTADDLAWATCVWHSVRFVGSATSTSR